MFPLSTIRRLYVRKKEGFRQVEKSLCNDLKEILGDKIDSVAIYHRYDVQGINDADYEQAKVTVFSEPPVDTITGDLPTGDIVIAVEFLPGQYDQRADSAEQCLAILTGNDGIRVRCALHYVFFGNFEVGDRKCILKFLVNPVESREASVEEVQTLALSIEQPSAVPVVKGVISSDEEGLSSIISHMGLAMSNEDMTLIRDYFRDTEHRDPTETEIRVLDTYWSDHCRHTTFSTDLEEVTCDDGHYMKPIEEALSSYLNTRNFIYGENTARPVTLMDMATAAVKELRKSGGI